MSLSALPIRTPSSRNWVSTLMAVCVAQAFAIAAFDFTLPFIPLYLQHDLGVHGLGQTAMWSGIIGFGPAIPATIFGPIWGKVADRFGYRAMLLRAMVSAALLLALMGLAPSPVVLLILRVIQGALTGTVFAAQALVASTAPEEETARSMGLLQMSVYVGATFGPIGGGIVAGMLGFRAAFAGAGVLLAIASAVVFLLVQEPERRATRARQEEAPRASILSVLTVPAFAAALVFTMLVQLAVTALMPLIPLFVQDLLHSASQVSVDTGWLMAVSGVAAAFGSFCTGRLNRYVGLRPLLLICAVLSAGLIVPQAFAANYLQLLVLRSAGAFAFGGLWALVGAWAALTSPREARGTAFGLMGAASSIGFGGGPLLGGALAASMGVRPVFLLSGVLVGLIPIVLFGSTAALPYLRSIRPVGALRPWPHSER